MKMIIISSIALLLTACGQPQQEGTFVRHSKNEFAVSDDTIVIKDNTVTSHVGYNKIRNGELKKREASSKTWRLNEPGTPVIVSEHDGLRLGNSFYIRLK